MKQMELMQHLIKCDMKNTVSLLAIPAKNTEPESNHKKTLDKSKSRDILHNWPVVFKTGIHENQWRTVKTKC